MLGHANHLVHIVSLWLFVSTNFSSWLNSSRLWRLRPFLSTLNHSHVFLDKIVIIAWSLYAKIMALIKVTWIWWFYHVVVKELNAGWFAGVLRELVAWAIFLLKRIIWTPASCTFKKIKLDLWILIVLLDFSNCWFRVISKPKLIKFYRLRAFCVITFWVQVFLNTFTSCIFLLLINFQFPVDQVFIACLFQFEFLRWLQGSSTRLMTQFHLWWVDNW